MKGYNTLVFEMGKDSLCEFRLTKEDELIYTMLTREGREIIKGIIDIQVPTFFADKGQSDTIYLAYIKGNKLKYCEFQRGQVRSKDICHFERDIHSVKELNLYLAGGVSHIFYLQQSEGKKDIGTLCHGIWNGVDFSINKISDVAMQSESYTCYQVEILDDDSILLIFIDSDGKEVMFKSCMHVKGVYSNIGSLFALKGGCIDFHMARFGTQYHILNLSLHKQLFTLEDIALKSPGKLQSIVKVFESRERVTDSLLITDNNELWAFWRLGEKLMCSIFSDKWSKAREIPFESEQTPKMHYYKSQYDNEKRPIRRVMVSMFPYPHFIFPEKLVEHEDNIVTNGLTNNLPIQCRAGEAIIASDQGQERTSNMPTEWHGMESWDHWKEIMKTGMREWRQTMCLRENGPSKDPKLNVRPSENMLREDIWLEELHRNCISLAREKARLEGDCAQLKQKVASLVEELERLKNEHGEREDRWKTELGDLKGENLSLKKDIEIEKNKSIFEVIFKR